MSVTFTVQKANRRNKTSNKPEEKKRQQKDPRKRNGLLIIYKITLDLIMPVALWGVR